MSTTFGCYRDVCGIGLPNGETGAYNIRPAVSPASREAGDALACRGARAPKDGRLPRLVPARLLAALRPDPSVPFELPSAAARESRRRVCVAALLGTLAYGAFLTLQLSALVGGSP